MKRTTLFFLLLGLSHWAQSQIKIDTSKTVNHLVENILLGNGVLVGNVKYTGTPYGMASFEDQDYNLHLQQGLALTTGNVFYANGPNRIPDKGWSSGSTGDPDLDQITQGNTFDAAILEFDFITSSEYLSFNYVFASEEYPEYVGSQYNDVFAFFVDGPDLDHVNLATLPHSEVPITINNVNHKKNKRYFNDNAFENTTHPFLWDNRKKKPVRNKRYGHKADPAPFNTQYDGFTQVMEARCKVIPNQVYHIKIAVADVSDGILDSSVFLEAGSFRSFGEQMVELIDPFPRETGQEQASTIQVFKPLTATAWLNTTVPPAVTLDTKADEKLVRIEFEFDSFEIPDSAYPRIDQVYDFMQENPEAALRVVGHTDSFGSLDYNYWLSQKRSQAVVKRLKQLGIQESSILVHYRGETEPIQTNETPLGRTRNRRVDFIFEYQGEQRTQNLGSASMANRP